MKSIHPTGHPLSGPSGPRQSPRWSPWRAGAVRLAAVPLLLVLAGGMAACGGDKADKDVASGGKPSGAPSASVAPAADNAERGRQFAACMRAEGIEMPDPGPNGMMRAETTEKRPSEAEMAKEEAALEKCRPYLPDGGDMPKISQEDVEKIRKYAKCMRENGAPGYPDPNPDGTITMKSSAMGTEAQIKKASEACAGQAPNMMPGIKVK